MNRRALFGIAVALGTVAAWIACRHLPAASRTYAAFLLVPLPVFMRWQARATGHDVEHLPRTGLYLSSALLLWILAAVTAGGAMADHLRAAQLGLMAGNPPVIAAWTVGTYAAGVAVLALGRMLHIAETPLLRHLVPHSALEKLAFTSLALTAGFAEELVFRGFLLWALTVASGSVTLAVVLSSVVFGMLHAYQDAGGAARAAILGAVLAAPVVATGSVIPAMIAHAAIDMTSGLVLAKWLLGGRR